MILSNLPVVPSELSYETNMAIGFLAFCFFVWVMTNFPDDD